MGVCGLNLLPRLLLVLGAAPIQILPYNKCKKLGEEIACFKGAYNNMHDQ
jgi:hypothetical protein